jgi:hypothetical protein
VVCANASDPRLTVAERMALTVRNAATASGRCACGATVRNVRRLDLPGPDRHYRAEMQHEPDCPAISKAALRAARKLGQHGA